MRIIFTLFLTAFVAAASSQNCKTYFTAQFTPSEQLPDDSVFYLFSLSNVYEFHANKEYRNIYNVIWFDHCKFDLIFDKSSDPEHPFKENEVFHCAVNFINDSSVQLQFAERSLSLNTYNDISVWTLMSMRDRDLKENYLELDSTLKAYKDLRDTEDSLNAVFKLLMELPKLMDQSMSTSIHELNAISLLFASLKNNDWKGFYDNGSTEFKDQIEGYIIQQYFSYLWNVYGKWEYFKVQGQSANTSLFGSQINEAGTAKFIFDVKLEKCSEEVKLTLVLSEENDIKENIDGKEDTYKITEGPKTFQSINIDWPDFEPSPYIDNLTSGFFEKLYKKQFSKIYKECSPYLKNEAPLDQVENMLSLANSMRNNEKYKLYKHIFSIDKKFGGLITIYYLAETSSKNIFLTLTYTADPNNHMLAGLHINEKAKK